MNQTIKLFAAVLLFALAFCLAVGAESYSPAVFKTTPFETAAGGEFTTTLYLDENSGVIDFEFQLKYDTEFVTLLDASAAADLVGDIEITEKTGAVHISYTRTSSNLTKKTDLVDLTFAVDGNAGPATYDYLTLDTAYQAEAHTMIDYDLFALPIETEFAPLCIYHFGDVNQSGNVSIADVTYLRQHLAEIRTLSDYQLSLADAFYDGNVSIADAVRMQQYLANASVRLGNRVNITFLDKEGAVYRIKSVLFGDSLDNIPALPAYTGYYGGVWSVNAGEAVGTDFRNLEEAITVYALYKKDASAAVTFYKERLTSVYYAQDTLTGNLTLASKMTYQDGYTADIYWSSSDSAILNATTGLFNKPAYDTTLTLTATIISYQDGMIEAQDYIAFDYTVKGEFLCPKKSEITAYLSGLFTEDIDTNMNLPVKVTNKELGTDYKFEVRLEWYQIYQPGEGEAVEERVVQINRTNADQNLTLVAVATFNGTPLEDDGRIYIDDVVVKAVSVSEIRSYIIRQIAENTGLTVTDNMKFWDEDTKYKTQIVWISGNKDIATIADNIITVGNVVSGTSLPIVVEVTYTIGEKTDTFKLAYTVSVVTDSSLLVPGSNIDPELYKAIKANLGINGNLTTETLKNVKFVSLDLSNYPEIRDLSALSYCENLRVLNISGLHVEESSLNQICTLSKLEALIANNCGIESFTIGGVPVLDKMINLKMLDLAHNNLSTLDSVFSRDKRYGQLLELYLNDNQLYDISALCEIVEETTDILDSEGQVTDTVTTTVIKNRAPMLQFLILDNNRLNDEDLAAFSNFKVLKYLSLGNNEISSVSALKDTRSLLELHLQGNNISDVRDLRYLSGLQSLYLGENNLRNAFLGAREVNISYLKYLSNLEILFLDGNAIEDISDLSALSKLAVLNVSDNQIQSLECVAGMGETLVELYAENNEIDTFSFVRELSGLKRLMLSGNGSVYESSLGTYLAGLTKLQILTLSGKELRSIEFIKSMPALVRLDIANCNLPSYMPVSYSLSGDTLAVNTYADNIEALLSRKSTLAYLDISNNGFGYGADGIASYFANTGAAAEIESVAFNTSMPLTMASLYEMTNLKVLYADNLYETFDANKLFSLMTQLQYLSLENCGITDAAWLYKFRNIIFVDLANNDLDDFGFGEYLSLRSHGTLEYLYLDTENETEFLNSFDAFDANVLKALSLRNVNLAVMDDLPDMDVLEYLDLSGTEITRFEGENDDLAGLFSLSRFGAIKTLDISGVQADIDEVLLLENLETLYAVGSVEDTIFTKHNLRLLQTLYKNGIVGYLYNYNDRYKPVAETEGSLILSTLPDYSTALTVAGEGKISENNPVLAESVNGFDIEWTLSNDDNYAIVDKKIAVADYTDIDDETLTLTATIQVYPDQAPVSRSFTMDMTVLRAETTAYLAVDTTGFSNYQTREAEFTYDVAIKAAETDKFDAPVLPVNTEVRYTYGAELANGSPAAYTDHVTVGDNHLFTVHADAALGATFTIRIDVGHTVAGEFVVDQIINQLVLIAERTFTVNFVANGGVVTANDDGRTLTSTQYMEDAVMLKDVSVNRPGFKFLGWYTDEECETLFLAPDGNDVTMPSEDLTLYVKWAPYSFMLNFDANGGSVSQNALAVLCGEPFGELPTPTRTGYTFDGWFMAEDEEIRSEDICLIEADTTVYAQWHVNTYTITLRGNYDGIGETLVMSKTVTYGAPYGVSSYWFARQGFTFSGLYTEPVGGTRITDASIYTVADDSTLYAHWTPLEYTASWTEPVGATIQVNRTSSPYKGAAIGLLSSGDAVYYGDVLSVTYTAKTGYTLGNCGKNSVTVAADVTSSSIYASATANSYTYNVVYKSSNGTDLGSTTVTYSYGTTNTVTPPSFAGYNTPGSQSVIWDSTSAKTITFVYTPTSVSTTPSLGNRTWQVHNGVSYLTSSAYLEIGERTANSVKVRIVWTHKIKAGYYDYNAMRFTASVGSVSTGQITVVPWGTWGNTSGYDRSLTNSSDWITVPVTPKQQTVAVSVKYTEHNNPGHVLDSGEFSITVTIPTF